ncbi:MAG: DUF4340 domain-containing protein [Armatimonadetes bacterium]|nr:DUF4340 domain-containing protein [Akkermansiaceae bacterium]
MKPRTIVILWIIAIVLGASVAVVKLSQGKENKDATKRLPGQTLLTDLPANDISSIAISGLDQSVTLEKKGTNWLVSQRDDYPANSRNINDLLRTLAELKITQGIEAGPSFAPRFGMDESASKPADHGLTATFKDAAGKELAKVSFGKNLDAAASSSPFGGGATGRYVRNHADESGFYAVSEVFGTLSPDPKSWLAEDFLIIEKIQTISVSKAGSDEVEWAVTRDDENSDFKFKDATAGETIDAAVAAPLKSLFSYARFDDVVPAAEVAKRATPDKLQKTTITTFEGFDYTIAFQPAKAIEAKAGADEEAALPATDNFLMTIEVSATLPAERKKDKDEKEEDAKTKDQAFADRLKTLTGRLDKEKALSGRTFEVSKFTVEALLKNRTALVSKAPAEAPAPPPPGPGTSAVTPPFQIPAQPALEEAPQEMPEPELPEE